MKTLEDFYRRSYDDLVQRVHRRYNKNVTEAEDVVQEAFMKAVRYYRNFDVNKGPIEAWFSTILSRTLSDYATKENKKQALPLEVVQHTLTDEDVPRLDIKEMVDDLPDTSDKEIIYRYYVLGETYKEVHQILNISLSSVKRACKKFRKGVINDT